MRKKVLLIIISIVCGTALFAQLKVSPNGRVGIGVNSPYSKFQVVGNSTFTASSGSITSAAFIRGLNAYSTDTTPDYTWYNNDRTGIFHPAANTIAFSNNGKESIRLSPNGYVGIGTTNPTANLHLYTGNNSQGKILIDNWTDVILDWTGASSSPTMYPSTNWYLQIGKPDKVIGTVYGSEFRAWGDLLLVSDSQIKENIVRFEKPLNKLKKISAYNYNLTRDFLGELPSDVTERYTQKKIGFLAQELASEFPELVTQPDSVNKYCSVNYIGMIPVLLEAIKEQQSQIDSLKQELSYLNNTNQTKSGERTDTDNSNNEYN